MATEQQSPKWKEIKDRKYINLKGNCSLSFSIQSRCPVGITDLCDCEFSNGSL